MFKNIPSLTGLSIYESRAIKDKYETVAYDWRTWKERFFSLPWEPGELFHYVKIVKSYTMIKHGDVLYCTAQGFEVLKNDPSLIDTAERGI